MNFKFALYFTLSIMSLASIVEADGFIWTTVWIIVSIVFCLLTFSVLAEDKK